MAQFDLTSALKAAFGLPGIGVYFPGIGSAQGNEIQYSSIPTIEVQPDQAVSLLGTPVIDQIYVKPVNYKVTTGGNITKTIAFGGYQLPDATIIEANLPKIIVKTPVSGDDGTIKEYIGLDDVQITIRSIIVNHNSDAYPADEVSRLHQMFKVNTSLQVINSFLNLIGVDEMVVERLQLLAVEGSSNIQPFVLECVSDKLYELKIREI